jgi:hypothetical protein
MASQGVKTGGDVVVLEDGRVKVVQDLSYERDGAGDGVSHERYGDNILQGGVEMNKLGPRCRLVKLFPIGVKALIPLEEERWPARVSRLVETLEAM